jgi:prephenate dehydratase
VAALPECSRIGYLGPAGTWAEEALLAHTPCAAGEAVAYPSVYDVINAVSTGEIEEGIVPMENAIEGSVFATLDMLTFDVDNVQIVREIVQPIHHRLIARADIPLDRIEKLFSHPHAHPQCRKFVREQLPQAEIVSTPSTAEAVRIVSQSDQKWAAIGSSLAAKNYGCVILREDIEDFTGNQTRFVMLSRTEAPLGLDTPYKTSIVCAIAHDQPGSLLQILQEFAHRYVNLTKIESRPSKKGLGDYVFFIDMEGKKDDPKIAPALKCLECKLNWVKLLGSYPVG